MVDVTKIIINDKANEIIISGVEIDSIWNLKDIPDEDAECIEVSYKFDISKSGARNYLYLVTKNNKAANKHVSMYQRLEALVGQALNLSSSFLIKDED